MKLRLRPLQVRILAHLARTRQVSVERLARDLHDVRERRERSPSEWDSEIRLQIDLLALYGVIRLDDGIGKRVCVATDTVLHWAAQHRVHHGRHRYKPAIVLPMFAAVLLGSTSGCSTHGVDQAAAPAAKIVRYNAEGTPPPERMEQFYNPRSGAMVYRFCVGDECPQPTPKIPSRRQYPIVTEIGADGTVTLVGQEIPAASAAPVPASAAPGPKTAANDPAAAKVVRQLEEQRRAVQAEAGVAQTPLAPAATVAPRMSVQKLGAGNKPPAPASNLKPSVPPSKPSARDSLPVEPSTRVRVPDAPSARAPDSRAPVLAQVAPGPLEVEGSGHAAAADAPPASLSGSPADFLAAWAERWSAQDADGYFALYAKDFWPSYGTATDPGTWTAMRRAVMTRPGAAISVDVKVVRVEEREDRFRVRFWQTFASKTFKSRVLKSMDLVKVDNAWRIRRERLIPVGPVQA